MGCGPKPSEGTAAAPPIDASRLAAVQACQAAGTAPGEPGERGAAIAAACAPVYRQPACRAAFEGWASTPVERRAWALASACRDAYCPTFEPPRPALCDVAEPDIETLWRLWPLLQARILADELGLVGPDRARYLASVPEGEPPAPIVIEVAPREPPAEPVGTVVVNMSGGGLVVAVGGTEHVVPEGPEALAERLRPLLAAHEGESVQIVAALDTDFSEVRALLDALKALGVSRIAINTAP